MDEGGPSQGHLNEALFGPVHGFYGTLANGSRVPIAALSIRFRNAVGRYNELTIRRKKSTPDRIEWRLNGAQLTPGPTRSVCELPHELLQRVVREGDRNVLMQATLWDSGERRKVVDATIDYEEKIEESRSPR